MSHAPAAVAGPVLERTSGHSLLGAAGVGVGVAAGTAVLAATGGRLGVDLCLLHATTGLACPLCGGLRAVGYLAHGDVLAAASSNLLVVAVVLPLLAIGWVRWVWHAARRRPALPLLATLLPSRRHQLTALGLFVAFAVWRNVPELPISGWLAP